MTNIERAELITAITTTYNGSTGVRLNTLCANALHELINGIEYEETDLLKEPSQ